MAFTTLSYLNDEDNLIHKAIVTVENSDIDYPAGRVTRLPVSDGARCLNRSDPMEWYVSFVETTDIDLIAIIGHNISPTATITVYGGSSFEPSTSLGTMTWSRNSLFKLFSSTQQYKYYKISISDTANLYGFSQIGYLIFSEAPTDLSFGYSYNTRYEDVINNLRDSTRFPVPVVKKLSEGQRLILDFPNKTSTNIDTLRQIFFDSKGESKPVLIIPDKTGSECVFGRLQDEFSRTWASPSIASTSIVVAEEPNPYPQVAELPYILAGQPLTSEWTFARPDSTAFYKDENLQLVSAAADEFRYKHYVDYGVCVALLEPETSTNTLERSQEIDDATWLKGGLAATPVTANATTAPDGTTTADLIHESSNNEAHYFYDAVAYGDVTDDTLQSTSIFLKGKERTKARVSVRKKGGTEGYLNVNLSDGSVQTDAITGAFGGYYLVERYVNDWWRIQISYPSGTGDNNPRILVYILNDSYTVSYTGDGSSGLYAWGGQFEVDTPFPTSYIPTSGTDATRDDEKLYCSWPTEMPMSMTWYLKHIANGQQYDETSRYWAYLGRDGVNSSPRYLLYKTGGSTYQSTYFSFLDDGSTGRSYTSRAVEPSALGDTVEVRSVFTNNLDEATKTGNSFNGATEVVDDTNTESLTPNWTQCDDPALYIGSNGAGTNEMTCMLIQKFVIEYGEQTLSTMRAYKP